MDSANGHVTGEIALKLFKGSVTPVARSSPYALYDRSLAGFGESGGGVLEAASPGFIELFSLQSGWRIGSGNAARGGGYLMYEMIGKAAVKGDRPHGRRSATGASCEWRPASLAAALLGGYFLATATSPRAERSRRCAPAQRELLAAASPPFMPLLALTSRRQTRLRRKFSCVLWSTC